MWRPLELMHCFIVTRRFLLLLWSGEVLTCTRIYTAPSIALSNKATSICFWFLLNWNFYVAPQLDHSHSFTHSLTHSFAFLLCSLSFSRRAIKKIHIQMMWTLLIMRMTEIENENKKLQTKLATFRGKKCVCEKCKKKRFNMVKPFSRSF